MTHINLYDDATVRLTERGMAVYQQYHDDLSVPLIAQPDEELRLTVPLALLMEIFGPACSRSLPRCFWGDEIELHEPV